MQIGEHDWHLDPFGRHIWRGRMEAGQLLALARAVKEEGGQLVALWGSDDRHLDGGFAIHAAFLTGAGLAWASSALPAEAPAYPDLAHIFPQADRMQRATFDLLGITASEAVDERKWLRHGAWPANVFPLRKDFDASQPPIHDTDAYPFIRVEGDGVHEIPVGPIHAGTIEPGHFRFSIIGERVLRLEQRLGYTHKGTEKRFEGMDLATGARLAGRVSGDSHSANAWAYCMAVETATASQVPERAVWLRALFLEIERIANHLGDLGYLGNDVALGFGFMQFWRLKEDWLRLSAKLFGHRYLFDCIVPGGVAKDIDDEWPRGTGRRGRPHRGGGAFAQGHLRRSRHAAGSLRQHRHRETRPGGAARPHGSRRTRQRAGLGRPRPVPAGALRPARRQHGNAAPRRRAGTRRSALRRSHRIAAPDPRAAHAPAGGRIHTPLNPAQDVCEGLGWVEGWRGEVVVAVRIGADGKLDRVHPHDPSWQNWPLLEIGVLGNIVPDFPLINKSFNLSYSGQDL